MPTAPPPQHSSPPPPPSARSNTHPSISSPQQPRAVDRPASTTQLQSHHPSWSLPYLSALVAVPAIPSTYTARPSIPSTAQLFPLEHQIHQQLQRQPSDDDEDITYDEDKENSNDTHLSTPQYHSLSSSTVTTSTSTFPSLRHSTDHPNTNTHDDTDTPLSIFIPPAPPPYPSLPRFSITHSDTPPSPPANPNASSAVIMSHLAPPQVPTSLRDITNNAVLPTAGAFSLSTNDQSTSVDTFANDSSRTASDDPDAATMATTMTTMTFDKQLDVDAMSAIPPLRRRNDFNGGGGGGGGGARVEDEDDEDGKFDVPDRLTIGPGAAAARLDLHRCTIRVHRQLVEKLRTNSMLPSSSPPQHGAENAHNTSTKHEGDELCRCEGMVYLKSRLPIRGWKRRYGSIVDHSYFGPVLFLFRYDGEGSIALQNSSMIVLVESEVRLGKNSTAKDGDYRCEFVLRTTKRRYVLAVNHTMRRDYWLRNLERIIRRATTVTE